MNGHALFIDGLRSRRAHERRHERQRWAGSLIVVLLASAGGVWGLTLVPKAEMVVAAEPPAAIAIDLTPLAPASPQTEQPVGPQQAVAQPVPELTPPEVAAPPSPAPNPPVPLPKLEKTKIIHKKVKTPTPPQPPSPVQLPAAQENTAPPASLAPPSQSSASPVSGASAARASHEKVTWQGELLARLEQFKRYPMEAQSKREEGTAMLHFSMDRKGHVLSVSIRTSSGHRVLDEETLALVRRAEPLPAPPDSIEGNPISLTVPVDFNLRDLGR